MAFSITAQTVADAGSLYNEGNTYYKDKDLQKLIMLMLQLNLRIRNMMMQLQAIKKLLSLRLK